MSNLYTVASVRFAGESEPAFKIQQYPGAGTASVNAAEVLPASTVAKIAARYGFEAGEKIVRDNAEQARGYHGKPCGRSENGKNGLFDAAMLLDSYLAQESYTGQCDAAAAAAFEYAAYGCDCDD